MVYSPSKTEAYDFCSLKGKIMYKDKWVPKEADNGTVGKIVGAAFARGTYDIHLGQGTGLEPAYRLFDRTTEHYVKYGVSFNTDLAAVRENLGKALVKYHAQNPFKSWQIKGAELELRDYGKCRLDVLGIDPNGIWSIADIKYKRQLKLDYLNKTVNEYRDSWQFQHYPWAYNDYINKQHVLGFEPCQQMVLVLVIAEPFKVLPFTFMVKDKLQARWITSAQQKWADISAIESGEREPIMATTHRDQYGDCPMKRACLDLDLDPALMAFEYVQVPRLPEEGPSGNT